MTTDREHLRIPRPRRRRLRGPARIALALLFVSSVVIAQPVPSGAGGEPGIQDGAVPGKELVEGAIDLISKLKDLLTKDAKVGVWASAKTDGPDTDDFSFEKDSDLDNIVGESTLKAGVFAEAQNDVDDPPADTPYTPNPSHYATVAIEASCSGCLNPLRSNVWTLVAQNPNLDEVWVVAQDDRNEDPPSSTPTRGAAAAMFSEDGKTAEACFAATVTNRTKSSGKLFEWERQDVKKVDKEKCSPLRPFVATVAGYLMADVDMFTFADLGNDMVRIEPAFGPLVDLFHTYWQREETRDLFPLLRGYADVARDVRRDLYRDRIDGTNLHLATDPAQRADFTVTGAALRVDPLEVVRAGRTDLQLLEEYFASTAVAVVAPEHAQLRYEPDVVARMVVHSGEDISAFVGRPFTLPANERGDGMGSDDPMVGVIVAVHGDIEDAVLLGASTRAHLLYQRLATVWDGSRLFHFRLTDMAIHHELTQTLASTYG